MSSCETDNDQTKQENELCALASIYDETNISNELAIQHDDIFRIIQLKVCNCNFEVDLKFTLCSSYPSQAPPLIEINCPALNRVQKSQLYDQLQEVCFEHLGEPVLYLCVEAVRQKLEIFYVLSNDSSASSSQNEMSRICSQESTSEAEIMAAFTVDLPEIFSGEAIIDRKSTFQAHLAYPLSDRSQVPLLLELLKQRGKVARATHNIHAFRLRGGSGECEDDGETQAGARLLHLMHMMRVDNALVVVSRWYGGIHLGPDRFRHINNAARALLEAHGFGQHRKQPQQPTTKPAGTGTKNHHKR